STARQRYCWRPGCSRTVRPTATCRPAVPAGAGGAGIRRIEPPTPLPNRLVAHGDTRPKPYFVGLPANDSSPFRRPVAAARFPRHIAIGRRDVTLEHEQAKSPGFGHGACRIFGGSEFTC